MTDNELIHEGQKNQQHQREQRTIRFSVFMGALLFLGMSFLGSQCSCEENKMLKTRIHECQEDLAEHHHPTPDAP